MNSNEFKRWLAKQGATFKPGKGSHIHVFLNGRRSVLPMHNTELNRHGRKHQEATGPQRNLNVFDYPVVLNAQPEGGFVVTFPDIPEAITQGEDEDEALMYAVEALESALSLYVDERSRLPAPSRPKRGQRTVRPSALECAKLGVYQAMTDQGIRKAELARRLGWHLPQIDRLFDLRHASRLDQLEAAAAALGQRLAVDVQPSDR